MILSIVIGAIFALVVVDIVRETRHRRRRDDMRHITGVSPWWGQR